MPKHMKSKTSARGKGVRPRTRSSELNALTNAVQHRRDRDRPHVQNPVVIDPVLLQTVPQSTVSDIPLTSCNPVCQTQIPGSSSGPSRSQPTLHPNTISPQPTGTFWSLQPTAAGSSTLQPMASSNVSSFPMHHSASFPQPQPTGSSWLQQPSATGSGILPPMASVDVSSLPIHPSSSFPQPTGSSWLPQTSATGSSVLPPLMSAGVSASQQFSQAAVPADTLGEHDPLLVINSSEIDIFVSDQIKEKIWNSKFVDLAQLLKSNVQNPSDNHLHLAFSNDKLVFQAQPKGKRIDNIDNWTEAFITFALIYIQRHQTRASELFKYMAIVRGAAQLNPFGNCYQYDIQFRLRMSNDPSRSWSNIDGHLWITCSLFGTSSSTQQPRPLGICYDFNYKGGCFKSFCKYAHTCMICKAAHPVGSCYKSNSQTETMRSNQAIDGSSSQPRPQFFRRFPSFQPNRYPFTPAAPGTQAFRPYSRKR